MFSKSSNKEANYSSGMMNILCNVDLYQITAWNGNNTKYIYMIYSHLELANAGKEPLTIHSWSKHFTSKLKSISFFKPIYKSLLFTNKRTYNVRLAINRIIDTVFEIKETIFIRDYITIKIRFVIIGKTLKM